jgi:hypothetical protein
MFTCCCVTGATAMPPPDARFAAYAGAGMIFTDGSVVLCGWEPRKRRPGLYGIGGKAENLVDHRDYRRTAAREVLEELYGAVPSATLVDRVAATFCSDGANATMVGDYVMVRCSFADLHRLLRVVAAARPTLKSPLYPTRLPRSLEELLFTRRSSVAAEMAQLCLLPVTQQVPRISSDLGGDIIRLWASDNPQLAGSNEKESSK